MDMIIRKKTKTFSLALTLLFFFSCSAIDEKWDDCVRNYKVKVVYDYNMLRADAFTSQVQNICFYIFDEKNRLVKEEVRKGPFVSNEFSFGLSDGKYRFACIASDVSDWTKLMHHWTLPTTHVGFSASQMSVSLKEINDGKTFSDDKLPTIWYASPVSPNNTDKTLHVNGYGTDKVLLNLIRNTNNIRLIIQKNGKSELNSEEYICELKNARNSYTDYADEVQDKGKFSYKPYIQKDDVLHNSGENSEQNLLIAEWDVNRLVKDSRMRLFVKHIGNEKPVFDMDLIPLLLMLRHEKYANMSEQEFLDREFEYEFYLILDESGEWLQLQIKVNEWVVRLNRIDL